MNDDKDLIKALYFLECIEETMTPDDMQELSIAAHYLVQRYRSGVEPEDFAEQMALADYVACPD